MHNVLGRGAVLFLFSSLLSVAQQAGGWHDASKHKVRFVPVEDGVKLEVLDWGGNGRPVVLLAGYLTAHAYDDFAEKLSEFCHVYGITRRGYGASSRPESGYTAERSAEDVIKVLDALRLPELPVLVGHSFGGQDLSTLGAEHSDRIAGLVYLNSAEDPTLGPDDYGVKPPDPKKLPSAMREGTAPSPHSFEAYREWQLRAHGVAFPEAELRNTFATNADGTMGKYLGSQKVRDAIFKGIRKPEYARIRVPVLAFFAVPRPVSAQVEEYKPKDVEERAAIEQKYAFDTALEKTQVRELKAGVPGARVVEVTGANFYIFLSNEAEIAREMRVFIAGLR